jgi:N-acetylneuraminic acid mutarotase
MWLPPISCDFRRSQHASTIVGDTVYIFGGIIHFCDTLVTLPGKSPNFSNDITQYNITKNEWVTIETNGKKPTGRYGSTVVKYQQFLYIFGGYDNYVQSCSEIFQFDLSINYFFIFVTD